MCQRGACYVESQQLSIRDSEPKPACPSGIPSGLFVVPPLAQKKKSDRSPLLNEHGEYFSLDFDLL